MYKTIRHGENSLQYTILPQHDESAAVAASATGGGATATAPKGIWPPTFIPPQSGELEPGTVIRAGSRKRSCLAYFGLVIVVSIMLGAIVVPVVLTTNFVTSGAGRGLKWYWPSASTSSESASLSVPVSLSMATGIVGGAAPAAAVPSAQPGPYVHKATDCDEPNIEAMLDISDGLLHGGALSTAEPDADVPAAVRSADDDDDDYLLDDSALTNGVADGGKVFNQEKRPPVAETTDGADGGLAAILTTSPTTAALPTTTIIPTTEAVALAASTTASRPPQVAVTPNIPGRKLRKPKVSRPHVNAATNRKVHAMATATTTTTASAMVDGGDGVRFANAGSAAINGGADDVAAVDAPVITAGGQRNWITAHWLGDGTTKTAGNKPSMWENPSAVHLVYGLLVLSSILVILVVMFIRSRCTMCRRKRTDLLTVEAQNGDNATLLTHGREEEEEEDEEDDATDEE